MLLQRWEINEVSSMIRRVSREKAHRKGPAVFFFEVKKWNWECGRPRKLEITNQNIKEESCRERVFQRSVDSLLTSNMLIKGQRLDRLDQKNKT